MGKSSRQSLRLFTVALLALAWLPPWLEAKAATADRAAAIAVKGLGWWQDREQRISLERLLGAERGETLDANAIEDAAFLLMAAVIDEGYLKPAIETKLTRADGGVTTLTFDAKLETALPRPFAARRVEFRVKRGVKYQFEKVTFTGLHALPTETAREFFLGEKTLIRRGAARVYSPDRLQRALGAIGGELRRIGYADATVVAQGVRVDDRTGGVVAAIAVNEGARWEVSSLSVENHGGGDGNLPALQKFVGEPWSPYWQEDVAAAVRDHFYRQGYPDVRVKLQPKVAAEVGGTKAVAVIVQVESGPAVRVGTVRFEGAKHTKESVLRRRVRGLPGTPLNPLAVEQARQRLARLGVFDSVELHYDPASGPVRDPVFAVREGRRIETNLLLGYGSYEQVRGGVELRQFNLFGRAHQSRLLVTQSMKSSRGEYRYTVPELFGESLDGTARAFGLRRQETSFLRQEYGANFSVSTPVHWLGATATLGYTFQSLGNRNSTLTTSGVDQQQVNSASVDLNLVRDRRDNPLRPRHGYRWFFRGVTASRYFGGAADYQRIEFGGSYHAGIGSGRWIHLGLTHGVDTTWGTNDATLPVNERFFPGGDNSIRGYREGEAAPIGPDGKFIGAKTYLLVNLELEQAVTSDWSVIAFGDALGTAVRLANYPFDERLYSVGLGVRYQTLIGPLRMEYGRNVHPRPTDPRGTLLFSIGFPF